MKIIFKEKHINSCLPVLIQCLLVCAPFVANSQSDKKIIKKYFKNLSSVPISKEFQRYRMTAVYTNMDLYGNFIDKVKVSGDYTRGLENEFVQWNNIFISKSANNSEPFDVAKKQEYMEDIKYVPSQKMLEAEAFKNFPVNPESVFSKNLIWDMMAIEGFAWNYVDSLNLNKIYLIPEIDERFGMADVGAYSHASVQLSWTGISAVKDELCAVIEFRAIDNKVELLMPGFKAKGTEQYWGTIWLSLKSKLIESALMFSGTIQEIDVEGVSEKLLIKTIRALEVAKIQ